VKRLVCVDLTSDNLQTMVEFYEQVLQIKPKWYGTGYVDFVTPVCRLSIQKPDNINFHENYSGPRIVTGGANRSLIIVFQVDDVDAENERLMKIDGIQIVKPISTQTWNYRSVWFRDPDRNIVNFYQNLNPR